MNTSSSVREGQEGVSLVAVRDVLVAAKELIADPKDWCGDSGVGEDGSRCMIYAIHGATGHCEWFDVPDGPTKLAANDALREAVGVSSIPGWNDLPTTTHEMVMQAFTDAIASVEAEIEIATRATSEQAVATSDAGPQVHKTKTPANHEVRRRPQTSQPIDAEAGVVVTA